MKRWIAIALLTLTISFGSTVAIKRAQAFAACTLTCGANELSAWYTTVSGGDPVAEFAAIGTIHCTGTNFTGCPYKYQIKVFGGPQLNQLKYQSPCYEGLGACGPPPIPIAAVILLETLPPSGQYVISFSVWSGTCAAPINVIRSISPIVTI